MVLIPALMGYAETAIFSALRVFAITDRNRVLSLSVLILISGPVVVYSYVIVIHGVPLPFIGPQPVICIPKTLIGDKLVLIRIPAIVGESIAVLVTWKNVYHRDQALANVRGSASLTQTLLRNGIAYFVAMIIINIAEILVISNGQQTTAFAGPFLDVLPPILICRFIMNLRRSSVCSGRARDLEPGPHSSGATQTVSLVLQNFSQRLEELGHPLDVGEGHARGRSPTGEMSGGQHVLSDSVAGDCTGENDITVAEYARLGWTVVVDDADCDPD
ncbi:uncharacterized protein PHACADRAFT_212678 [Phanerochaete carnosa HHB-10118-sp]|uniref:Uncharacterized protein n=1 Tax=Phanerochaete carnosa (strain HHB-10118-sp) TaxID=650164 RepID=K5VL01_PHACS|nr:uncharacterized protein PHACADRAFT_212678 [Phanerochaete carnosa HHB-10118-sp]EKM52088.1 hypothetical protein PHACADRAFT_212678 [Phanerochaete carnosa HHB-10118-sp]